MSHTRSTHRVLQVLWVDAVLKGVDIANARTSVHNDQTVIQAQVGLGGGGLRGIIINICLSGRCR